ncbi:MAG TPA: potassium channel protein [Tepidiformaceae bacterium]|nr:potassium channel protein [Tepidiformaceae bacterium]
MHRPAWLFVPFGPRVAAALMLLGSVVVVGTIGYMALTEMSFVDALYQTVTTLSTVGFRELRPFDTADKLFTVALIFLGVGTALYTLTLVVQEALEGDFRSRFYARRMTMEIEKIENHYVLCGFGRVGTEIARELSERGVPFVVIDQTPSEVERARAFGYLVIEGDASEERTLVQANLHRARCLLAASDSDSGNTYITLTARAMNPNLFIVARVAYPQNDEKLRLAGADRVISLYSMGGRRMVLSALQPRAADFMDTIATGRTGELLLVEFEVDAASGLVGGIARDLISGARNVILLAIRHRDGKFVIGPREEEPLHEGDIVIAMAEEPDLARMSGGAPTPT